MFVTDSPHISQLKIGKHANHNVYVDFFTDLTKTVWDKRKVFQCSDEWILILTGGYIILATKVYFFGVNYDMFIGNVQ